MSKNFILNACGRYMRYTYLSTSELSDRIKYEVRTIRDRLKESVLLERRHYIRPFGGRKILFIWETTEADMMASGAFAVRWLTVISQ